MINDDLNRRNEARKKWAPERVKYLFICEAPPMKQENAVDDRYFYFEESKTQDGLFVNMVRMIIPRVADLKAKKIRSMKGELLGELKDLGVLIVDAIEERVVSNTSELDRITMIRQSWSSLRRHKDFRGRLADELRIS